jgi:hypothetical protein
MRLTEGELRRLIREVITVGDVRTALKYARDKRDKEAAIAAAKAAGGKVMKKGVEAVMGLFPGGGTLWSVVSGAKDIADIVSAAANTGPEEKKKNPLWDQLTVDPDTSAIVDDEVEERFVKDLAGAVEGLPDGDPFPDADDQLANWLKGKFSGAHVRKGD